MSRLEALKARIEAEQAAAAAAKSALSPEDIEELELRKRLQAAEEERERAEQDKRDLDLARREEAARETNGPDAKITSIAIKNYPDSFVIMHDQAAYKAWRELINKSLTNKKIDKPAAARDYAVAVVIDWNGKTDFMADDADGKNTVGHNLYEYLKKNDGIVDAITNAAAELAGVFREDRKS